MYVYYECNIMNNLPNRIINVHPVDPATLRIVIISTPKTGNTWLRVLLRHAYGLKNAELPQPFNEAEADKLGYRWITHCHVLPKADMLTWLTNNRVTVLTTIRHPGDTLVSLFHYLRWTCDTNNPAYTMMLSDGDRPGRGLHRYARQLYAQNYAISDAWPKLGSHLVRYEDLLANPLCELRRITGLIQTVDDSLLRLAVTLGDPVLMRIYKEVDPRHIRKAVSNQWSSDLSAETIDFLRTNAPFNELATLHGYTWSATDGGTAEPLFDYSSVNPLGKTTTFDNGDQITPTLLKIYIGQLAAKPGRWTEPAA